MSKPKHQPKTKAEPEEPEVTPLDDTELPEREDGEAGTTEDNPFIGRNVDR